MIAHLIKSLGSLRRQKVMTEIRTCLQHQDKNRSRHMKMIWKMNLNWCCKPETQTANTACFCPSEKSVQKLLRMSKAGELPPKRKNQLDKAITGMNFHKRGQRVLKSDVIEVLQAKYLPFQSSFQTDSFIIVIHFWGPCLCH